MSMSDVLIPESRIPVVVREMRLRYLQGLITATRDNLKGLGSYNSQRRYDMLFGNDLSDMQRFLQYTAYHRLDVSFVYQPGAGSSYGNGDITRLRSTDEFFIKSDEIIFSMLMAASAVTPGGFIAVPARRDYGACDKALSVVYLYLDEKQATQLLPQSTLKHSARAVLPSPLTLASRSTITDNAPNLCLWRICNVPYFASIHVTSGHITEYNLSDLGGRIQYDADEFPYLIYAPDKLGICTMDAGTFVILFSQFKKRLNYLPIPFQFLQAVENVILGGRRP